MIATATVIRAPKLIAPTTDLCVKDFGGAELSAEGSRLPEALDVRHELHLDSRLLICKSVFRGR